MKKLIILAALSLAPVFAATTTCTTQTIYGPAISGTLDVPSGQTCRLVGGVVNGNVTVEGTLYSYSTMFNGNVTVTGGVIVISNGNGAASAIAGNLSITGSSGNNQIGCPNISNIVGGNISFTGNSGNLYVCQATVGKGVTVNYNTRINNDYSGWYVADLNNMTIARNLSCSGNSPAPTSTSITPSTSSTITAQQKLDQCAGL